jgi:hypothetical protein
MLYPLSYWGGKADSHSRGKPGIVKRKGLSGQGTPLPVWGVALQGPMWYYEQEAGLEPGIPRRLPMMSGGVRYECHGVFWSAGHGELQNCAARFTHMQGFCYQKLTWQ